jgi:YVTN family beta-propeller protein
VARHHLSCVYRMRTARLLVGFVVFLSLTLFAAELRRVAIVDLPGPPGFGGLAFAKGMLLIAHGGAGTVDLFNLPRRRVVDQIPDMGDVQGIAVNEKTGTAYVANASGKSIAVISTWDWKVTDTVPMQSPPYALALSSDGATLFVANWRDQSVSTVDVAHGFRVKTVQVGGTPDGLVYDPEARVVYASLEDRAEVIAVDANLNIVRHIKLIASQPAGLALDAAARRLYVAVRHAVSAVQVDTGVEVGRLPAPVGADSLWLDTGSGTLFVGSAGGTISLMRATGTEFLPLGDVSTDVRGSTLAYDASRGLLYMPGGREGKSKLLILRRVEPGQAANQPAQ